MLKCTIINKFTESFSSSNSACFEGWVMFTAHLRVLISQFEPATQQRCAPWWDWGAAGARSQVWWGCLRFSCLDVVSAIHSCVLTGLAQRDHTFQEKSQRKMLTSCSSHFGDGKSMVENWRCQPNHHKILPSNERGPSDGKWRYNYRLEKSKISSCCCCCCLRLFPL